MRLFLVLAAAAVALPAFAQSVPSETAPRTKFVDIIQGDACPKASDPNEIVVCRAIPADSQFRLSPAIRNEQNIARRDNVAEQRAALVDSGVRNGGTCSSVGVGGQAGCTGGLNVLGAGKKVIEAIRGEDTVPDKVPQ